MVTEDTNYCLLWVEKETIQKLAETIQERTQKATPLHKPVTDEILTELHLATLRDTLWNPEYRDIQKRLQKITKTQHPLCLTTEELHHLKKESLLPPELAHIKIPETQPNENPT